jgi:rhodanese-related sulfurtransferase
MTHHLDSRPLFFKKDAIKTAAVMVAEARVRVENLSADDVARESLAGTALLVDLRETEERERDGVIPGALHVPRGQLEFFADPMSPYHLRELAFARRIILHCTTGNRSVLAADLLQSMGYHNVAHLEGGYRAWCDRGHTILRLGAREAAA